MASVDDLDVKIGVFADPADVNDSICLHRSQVPTKFGGEPGWISSSIPRAKHLTCRKCEKATTFLMQLYAPIETIPQAYHRMLYIFGCENCGDDVRVYRFQCAADSGILPAHLPTGEAAVAFASAFDEANVLPEDRYMTPRKLREEIIDVLYEDEFYSSDEESDDEIDEHMAAGQTDEPNADEDVNGNMNENDDHETHDHTEEAQPVVDEEEDMDVSEMVAFEKLQRENTAKELFDPIYQRYDRRVVAMPDHILRYQRNGEPLWYATPGRLETSPGPCHNCGAARVYECQLQSQLLGAADDLLTSKFDFGIVAIYTCSQSCESRSHYVEEFAYIQHEPGAYKLKALGDQQ